MHIAVKILIVVLVIIAIPFVIALFTKKDYAVSREVIINQPKQQVYDYVKFTKNSEKFSVWVMKDPNSKKEYVGTDGTVGYIYKWDSEDKSAGKGAQETKALTDGQRIDYELRFEKPMKNVAQAYYTFDSIAPNQTKVKWAFEGRNEYPFNFVMVVMDLDKVLGKDMATSLSNLKGILEKK